MTATAPSPSSELEQAITDARAVSEVRHHGDAGITSLDRCSAGALGGFYMLTTTALVVTHGVPSVRVTVTFLLLAAVHSLASKVVFESAGGGAIPTQPTLVAGLFLLPIELVPIMVLVSLLVSTRKESRSRHDLLVRAVSGWHCVGPVAVLALAAPGTVDLGDWPVYLLALVAQFALDAGIAVIRCRALDIPWTVLPRPMAWSWSIDALLAPIGVAAVLATDASLWSLLIVCCPIGVLLLLGRDRAEHFEKAVVISEAFEAAVESARHDPVSGIANRRAWNEATAGAALRFAANPMGRSVTVVLADVDGLKTVNDTLGHDAGDDLIRAAAEVFISAAPAGALVARVGGDEFGMLVADVDQPDLDAATLVARVRAAIANHPPVHGVRLSLSVGGASCPPYADVEAAQAAADERALADKLARRAGRPG